MLSAEHSRALKVALVAQRNGHNGEQGVEEPLPGVQTLTVTVAHSDVFAPPVSIHSPLGAPLGVPRGRSWHCPPSLCS